MCQYECNLENAKVNYLETTGELNHFFGLTVLETVNTGNTITNRQDTTSLLEVNFRVGTQDTLFKDGRDLRGGRLGGSITTSSSGNSTEVDTGLYK